MSKSFLQKLHPINVEQEKQKFFFDPLYNPQFEYEEEVSEDDFYRYGGVSFELLSQAQQILQLVLKQFESETQYYEKAGGDLLTKEQAEQVVSTYLGMYELDEEIQIEFSPHFASRTSIFQNRLRMRLPIHYRGKSLRGMLNHEIGTHYFRRLNEMQQPWFLKHRQFGLSSYLETEEGLATMHSKLFADEKYVWSAALSYYTVCRAEELSFSELFKDLEKFVDDPERRWKYCVKAKRGIEDTSQSGGFSRGQLYFTGVVRVAQWMEKHHFEVPRLYLGKIALEDIEKVERIQSNIHVRLPNFLTTGFEEYVSEMREVIRINKLTTK